MQMRKMKLAQRLHDLSDSESSEEAQEEKEPEANNQLEIIVQTNLIQEEQIQRPTRHESNKDNKTPRKGSSSFKQPRKKIDIFGELSKIVEES